MKMEASTPAAYIRQLPADRQKPLRQLRKTIKNHLPSGFRESMSYGMIGYVVPHKRYPPGYHCDPDLPLPFINIASQKHHIALYHYGIYADPKLMSWFVREYPKHCDGKLDMGKCCIRFKNIPQIPFELIGELVQKMTVEDWIARYESRNG